MHVYIHTTTDKYGVTFITEVTSDFDDTAPNWQYRVFGRGWVNYPDAQAKGDKFYYVSKFAVDDGPAWEIFPRLNIDEDRCDWGTKENPITKAEFDALPRTVSVVYGFDGSPYNSVDPAPGFANLTRVFEGIQQTLALPMSDSSKVQVIEAIIRDDKLSYGYRGE